MGDPHGGSTMGVPMGDTPLGNPTWGVRHEESRGGPLVGSPHGEFTMGGPHGGSPWGVPHGEKIMRKIMRTNYENFFWRKMNKF